MKREIKLKAIYNNEIYKVGGINFEGGYTFVEGKTVTLISDKMVFSVNLSEVTLLQYTGLIDKNGVEIYEGDILELFSERSALVPLHYRICVEYQNGCYKYHANYKTSEVIGNIYENPELLT